MKNFLLICLVLFTTTNMKAQRFEADKKVSFIFPKSDSTVYIKVYVKDSRPGTQYRLQVSDLNRGTANFGGDYTFENPLRKATPFQFLDSFAVILKSNLAADETKTIQLQLKAVNEDTTLSNILVVALDPRATAKKAVKKINHPQPDTNHVSLSLLTAASFDFFGQSTFGKYAGNLNLHIPHIMGRLGLNAGISHLHYYTADSSSSKIYSANVLTAPYAKLTDTTKYRATTYALNSKTDHKTWSYYGQVLWYTGQEAVAAKDAISRFYLTAHFEVFSVEGKTTYTVDSLQNFSLTYDSTRDRRKVFVAGGGIRPKEVVNKSINGYFGLGGTWIGEYPNKFNTFFQGILGFTTETPQQIYRDPVSDRAESTVLTNFRVANSTTQSISGFYLIRTQVVEKFTKLNGTIGVDIRGLFPRYSPLIAAYLGIQLKFDDFFKGK